MKTSNGWFQAAARSPFLWGLLACAGFYSMIQSGTPANEFIERYFAKHPVEYVATAMFFVGMAALAGKVFSIAVERRGSGGLLLGPVPPGGQPVGDCEQLLERLRQLPQTKRAGYRVRRLHDAVEHVRRSGTAESLDEEIKYLADLDAGRAHESYGLVRMIIWAIPILGFLGTVIGITLAIAQLAPEALETSLPMVTSGLGVAFDTTALALGLSIVLMFALFLTERAENSLLARVDEAVDHELVGRFEKISEGPDGQIVAVRRMIETVVASTHDLVRRQAELWQTSLDAAQTRWNTMADTAGERLQSALSGALAESLELHARELVGAEEQTRQKNRRSWERIQQALVENTHEVGELQKAVIEKAEALDRASEATDRVATLQQTLTRNLEALAGAKSFEQTVLSLAAVLHLLTAKLGDLPGDLSAIKLDSESGDQPGQAA